MPVTIVLRTESGPPSSKEAERALTFDGSRVVIGRGPNSDVRLPDPSVSHRHAIVRQTGSTWELVDEGSSNGTFVGGVRLSRGSPRSLRGGDLVRVGRVWLEVRIDQSPPTRELAGATRDLALALVAEAMEKIGDDVTTKLRVVEGRDRDAVLRLAEEGRVYTIGRAEECDLPLADADASREHARIVRRGQMVLVRDMGSRNGTLLADVRIPSDRDTGWKGSAMLRIGKTVLALEEPAQLALDQLEAAADEIIPAEEKPAPPPEAPAPASKKKPEIEEPKPASQRQPGAAPIAQVGSVVTKTSTTVSTRRVSGTDIAVGLVALIVIGLSIAGMVWLLKG
jgi:pSer/pThr/pTyr-binding forkhead associated (FHA) protein